MLFLPPSRQRQSTEGINIFTNFLCGPGSRRIWPSLFLGWRSYEAARCGSSVLCLFCIVVFLGDGEGGHWLFRMEWRSAGWSVCLPLSSLHHKVQKFSSGTGSPGGPGQRAVKWLWSWWWWCSTFCVLDEHFLLLCLSCFLQY